ncbi:MAG: RNA polymerase sigma factor region1.1 domain-containing protein [Eubacteriales bacterium]|nr:RNA polymerase sigma factor region1.1 domain-containing protein [Eubacteriales bacterium]
MEIQKFQEKMAALLVQAKEQGGLLHAEEVRQALEGLELSAVQQKELLRYLGLQGVQVEGMEAAAETGTLADRDAEEASETEEERSRKSAVESVIERLSEQDREYLEDCRSSMKGEPRERLLGAALEAALEFYTEEVSLADQIQEANLSLFAALEQAEEEEQVIALMRSGLQEALSGYQQRSISDAALVEKVRKLDEAVKDLSEDEDGNETPFSVNELAIILDMEPEEMKDILRLTGDETE